MEDVREPMALWDIALGAHYHVWGLPSLICLGSAYQI